MACSYKTITLTPGEQFILPPGAEIIGVSDTTALEATNGCATLDNLEQPECYAVVFGEASPGGSETPVYNDVQIYGISVNGVGYGFSPQGFPVVGGINGTSAQTIKNAIDSTPYGSVITDLKRNLRSDSDRGIVVYVVFKTYPSIANGMKFLAYGSGMVASPTTSGIPMEYPVYKYDERPGGGSFSWPSC